MCLARLPHGHDPADLVTCLTFVSNQLLPAALAPFPWHFWGNWGDDIFWERNEDHTSPSHRPLGSVGCGRCLTHNQRPRPHSSCRSSCLVSFVCLCALRKAAAAAAVQQWRSRSIPGQEPCEINPHLAEILPRIRVTASFQHRERQGSRDDLLPAPTHILL